MPRASCTASRTAPLLTSFHTSRLPHFQRTEALRGAEPNLPPVEPTPETEWTVHLAARQPGRAALVVGAILAAGIWAAYVFRHPVGFLMAAGLLAGAVSDFLFPVRYRLTAEHAEARGPLTWRRIEWQEVKRVYVGKEEIKLSPLKHGGPREAFRGVVLRVNGDVEPVLAAIRAFRKAAVSDQPEESDAAASD